MTWLAPIAAAVIGAMAGSKGGGGGGYSPMQERLFGSQADIAKLMLKQMQSRFNKIETPYLSRAMQNAFGFGESQMNKPRSVMWAPGLFEPTLRDDRYTSPAAGTPLPGSEGPIADVTVDPTDMLMDDQAVKDYYENAHKPFDPFAGLETLLTTHPTAFKPDIPEIDFTSELSPLMDRISGLEDLWNTRDAPDYSGPIQGLGNELQTLRTLIESLQPQLGGTPVDPPVTPVDGDLVDPEDGFGPDVDLPVDVDHFDPEYDFGPDVDIPLEDDGTFTPLVLPEFVDTLLGGGSPKGIVPESPPGGTHTIVGNEERPPVIQVPFDTGARPPVGQVPFDTGARPPVIQVPFDTGARPPVGQVPFDTGARPPVNQTPWDTGARAPIGGFEDILKLLSNTYTGPVGTGQREIMELPEMGGDASVSLGPYTGPTSTDQSLLADFGPKPPVDPVPFDTGARPPVIQGLFDTGARPPVIQGPDQSLLPDFGLQPTVVPQGLEQMNLDMGATFPSAPIDNLDPRPVLGGFEDILKLLSNTYTGPTSTDQSLMPDFGLQPTVVPQGPDQSLLPDFGLSPTVVPQGPDQSLMPDFGLSPMNQELAPSPPIDSAAGLLRMLSQGAETPFDPDELSTGPFIDPHLAMGTTEFTPVEDPPIDMSIGELLSEGGFKPPGFGGPQEEFDYLRSLGNQATPDQMTRMMDLYRALGQLSPNIPLDY